MGGDAGSVGREAKHRALRACEGRWGALLRQARGIAWRDCSREMLCVCAVVVCAVVVQWACVACVASPVAPRYSRDKAEIEPR